MLVMAATSIVVLAFSIPLGVLVRDLARDRALSAARRSAETLARTMTVLPPDQPALTAALVAGGEGDVQVAVVLADGTSIGGLTADLEALGRARAGSAVQIEEPGGVGFYVPVLGAAETVVVHSFVADEILTRQVGTAWAVLAGLGAVLIGLAALVADRLGRSMVSPVEELAAAAHTVGEGNLDARVVPAGPPELIEVGRAFNQLAEKVGVLLAAEREAVADLSHRLRTPLTALRLDAGSLPEVDGAAEVREGIEAMERAVDHLIREARRPMREAGGVLTDLTAVVAHRVAFWSALAEDQGRRLQFERPARPSLIPASRSDLEAVIDALIGNVFAHTPEGTWFSVSLDVAGPVVELTVEDGGPGFPDLGLTARGESGSDSTGLGLDIVRRTAEATGGSLTIENRPAGGSRVVAKFGRSG